MLFPMNNFTTNTYEMKKEIVNFSKNISLGVNKSTSKFVLDMQYGLLDLCQVFRHFFMDKLLIHI